MQIDVTFEVPKQWEHDLQGYVNMLTMLLRREGHSPIEWSER